MKPKIAVLYHFYYPDDVVSARHFQDLCENLTGNWDVEVWPSNRSCRSDRKYPASEIYRGVRIRRLWRPPFSQAKAVGRILNSFWMIAGWWVRWLFCPAREKPRVLLIGTDPVLALMTAALIRIFDKQVKIVHWCFDLFPEAAVVDGKISENGFLHRLLKKNMSYAYIACDVIVDLGACMRTRLLAYPSSRARQETLEPWAFYEPKQLQCPEKAERKNLFGDAKLGVLYSGNFGLAHTADLSVELSKRLDSDPIRFCFSIRGNAERSFKQTCAEKKIPISFADFATENQLNLRLEAADIHLVSLKETWTGTVVPSKFFGCLAAGRPVIFEGSENSSIAKIICEHKVGWVLTEKTLDVVASDLKRLALQSAELKQMQMHCLRIYQEHFSKQKILQRWQLILSSLT